MLSYSAMVLVTPFTPWSDNMKEVRTMGDVTPEVATDDDVPGWVKLFIALALNVGCDILFDSMLLKGVGHDGDDLSLHVLAHVHISYDRLGSPGRLRRGRYISWRGHGSGYRALWGCFATVAKRERCGVQMSARPRVVGKFRNNAWAKP